MSGLRADQQRAIYAYERVREVPPAERDDYESAVLALGVNVLRGGLCGALATLQRDRERPSIQLLFQHLARAGIPGLAEDAELGPPEQALPEQARNLKADGYMLATRELLLVIQWFKRAAQAVFQRP